MPEEPAAAQFRIEPLASKHERAAFSCGVEELDRYLHELAGQDVRKRVAAVFVLTPNGRTVAGYYTLSQFSVELDAVPDAVAKRLPKYPHVPATLLGRLAVSGEFRGQGLGEHLLMDALSRSLETSRKVPSAAVIVDAKDENSAEFYRKYGFLDLPRIANRLFLPMKTVEKLLS